MPSNIEPQSLLECLHDAVVKDVRLDGLDLVLHVSMPVDTAKVRTTTQPKGRACRFASWPFELVFKEFHGLVPWGIKGHTLGLLQEKDGAYLIETDALEDHVVWASSLSPRLSSLSESSHAQSPHGASR